MKSKNLKKVTVTLLASAMLMPSVVSAKEFSDVTRTNRFSWAYNDIDVLSDKGIIKGYPDGTFKPDDSVSFEEVMELISQVLKPSESEISEARKKYDNTLTENNVDDWAKNSVAIALSRGYLTESNLKSAYEQGLLKRNDKSYPIRTDIAIFFAKALNLDPNGDQNLLKHKDVNQMRSNLRGYLASLVKADIFASTGSDGYFQGDRPIRRAEMAKITRASFDYVSRNPIQTNKMKGKVLLSSKLNEINLIVIESNNKKYTFDIDGATKFQLKGKEAKFEDVKPEQEVEIEYIKSNDSSKEGLAKVVNITNTMQNLVGYVNSKETNKLTIRYRQNSDTINFRTTTKISTSDTNTFELDKNVKIKAYGKDIKLDDIKVDDLVEFKLGTDNKITEITVFPKEANVKGKVVYLDRTNKDKASLKLRLSDNKDYEFYITNETKNINDVSLNDEVIIKANYKVVVGKANINENEAIGVVQEIDTTGSPFDSFHDRRPYVEIRTAEGATKTYILNNDVDVHEKSGIRRTQTSESNLRGQSVILKLDNRGFVTDIYIVDKGSQFSGMFQVIDQTDIGGFGSHSYYRNRLRVIQSNNDSLKPGSTVYFDSNNLFKDYTVLTFDGYINRDTKLQFVTNVQEKGNPGRLLRTDSRTRDARNFRDYKEFDDNYTDNRGNSSGYYYY
ncbi:S-layer homology domain-containing protein [Peptoniphilus sp. MSJ-1]|uniref:S-layer homology domain-containing protein n=1 Tax=Peptoniphilus ovalis TaxID=2841503 RepID=A0ABS6FG15_9FIRM|nr:S-layer homology domain-containing protein [Peptoniphilus ovalis]MBU5669104.1 S-layer homology domain-containing protein [Peptoniphilus ovalis]